MREEHEKMNRGRHKEQKEKKHMSGGGRMGEKTHKASGYEDSDWGKVHAMLTGKHPTTNICTNAAGGGRAEKMAAKGVEGGRKKYAAGGVGKIRHEAYD